jgi:long-subunit acyl-CoA synthetase (AMP-forming)
MRRSRQGDVHISYLPLAHIYERVIIYTCIHTGTGVSLPIALW